MLKKWVTDKGNGNSGSPAQDPAKDLSHNRETMTSVEPVSQRKVNYIQKGSTVTGDIRVTCDLVLNGDVEGNITAEKDSNIVIKGSCRGNIETGNGNIDIRGELRSGSITTGGNVSISGKFTGGEVKAKGKIYVNCEFTGKLEGNEIEIGSNAHIKGQLFYRDYISVARGAKVEVHLCRIHEQNKGESHTPEKKEADMKSPVKELIHMK